MLITQGSMDSFLTNVLTGLHRESALRLHHTLKDKQFQSPGLLSGELGKAMFLTSSCLSGNCADEEIPSLLYTSLNNSINGIESLNDGLTYSLSDGLPGLLILLNTLQEHQLLDDESLNMLTPSSGASLPAAGLRCGQTCA